LYVIVYAHNLSQASYGGDVGDLLTASAVMALPIRRLPTFYDTWFSSFQNTFYSPAFMIGLIQLYQDFGTVFLLFFAYKFTKSKLISLISVLVWHFLLLLVLQRNRRGFCVK